MRAALARLWLTLAVCTACGGSDGSVAPLSRPAVATVSVPAVLFALAPGGQVGFFAFVNDASGNRLLDRTVTWSTSNAAIMTVDVNTGQGIAVAVGTVTITGTCEGIKGTTTVVITPP
jgi:Bacterial Ig-like domain (group 2)